MSSEIQPPTRSRRACRAAVRSVPATRSRREDLRRRLVHRVADRGDVEARVERLVRQHRRADDAAAAALGAGVAVEHRLPRQVLDSRGAEPLGLLEVRRREAAGRVELHEEDVRDRRQDVEVLRVRQVVAEEEDVHEMGPPGGVVERLELRRGDAGSAARDRRRRPAPSGSRAAARSATRAPSATRSAEMRSAIRNRTNQASAVRSSRAGRAKARR